MHSEELQDKMGGMIEMRYLILGITLGIGLSIVVDIIEEKDRRLIRC